MRRLIGAILILAVSGGLSTGFAQRGEKPLRIFGYFQVSFQHESVKQENVEFNTFNLQQLNLFLQKNLSRRWSAFVSFEVLNNFSSSRNWGAFNLEEAWIRYRSSKQFNLKLGLQIPVFNNFNEIKNRTPLLPYIIRPLVYETSLSEEIPSLQREEYFPARAFVQAYGFFPYRDIKFEYALYVGNSPNINNRNNLGQSGIDTTNSFLLGGRAGLRLKDLKAGISATFEEVNLFKGAEQFFGGAPSRFEKVPRYRLGADLSFHWNKFYLEGEYILVKYNDDAPEITFDKNFIYGTLGYHISDQWFVYGSLWLTTEDYFGEFELDGEPSIFSGLELNIDVPTVGISYNLNDRIRLKAQYAPVEINSNNQMLHPDIKFNFYAAAASVNF